MTDFELVSLYSATFNTWIMLFTTYVSFVFAFLVAGMLAAPKLNRVLATTAVGLFTLAAAFFFMLTMILAANVITLGQYITTEVIEGRSGLDWVGFVKNRSETLPFVLTNLCAGLMLAGYVGAVFFFYHQRQRKSQMADSSPRGAPD